MIPELGNFALMLAALVAVMQGVLPIAGTLVRTPQTQITLQSLARPTAALQFVLVAFAFGALATSFLNNDFSVLYVSQHSNSLLPPTNSPQYGVGTKARSCCGCCCWLCGQWLWRCSRAACHLTW